MLVLGTGEIGEGDRAGLQEPRARRTSRSPAGARSGPPRSPRASAPRRCPLRSATRRLAEYDIVVCSTAAPDGRPDRGRVAAAMRRRPARPLLLIDLALPRDVEASRRRAPERLPLQPRRPGEDRRGEPLRARGRDRAVPGDPRPAGGRALEPASSSTWLRRRPSSDAAAPGARARPARPPRPDGRYGRLRGEPVGLVDRRPGSTSMARQLGRLRQPCARAGRRIADAGRKLAPPAPPASPRPG